MSGPVLVAEDEESDALILRLAFAKAGLSDSLVIVENGQEAVDYLSGKAPYNDRAAHPLPSVVLLDLKMPRLSGFEVLKWLRENSALRKKVPAVVLSASPDESDIRKARQMGACDYFVKPFGVNELVDIVQTVRARWLEPH